MERSGAPRGHRPGGHPGRRRRPGRPAGRGGRRGPLDRHRGAGRHRGRRQRMAEEVGAPTPSWSPRPAGSRWASSASTWPYGVADLGMAVAAGWRGRGVGAALLAEAVDRAGKAGAHKLALRVTDTTPPPSPCTNGSVSSAKAAASAPHPASCGTRSSWACRWTDRAGRLTASCSRSRRPSRPWTGSSASGPTGGRAAASTASTAPSPGRGVLDRHPAADGQRLAAPRPRLLLHPDRRDRPVPADARPGGVLPDGLGRQRQPADRAPGPAAPLPGVRCDPSLLQAGLRAARVAVPPADRRVPAQLHGALQPAHHGGRAGLRGRLPPAGAVGRLVACLCHRRRAGPAGLPAGVPAPAGQGLAYQAGAPVGGRLPHRRRPGRAGGPPGRACPPAGAVRRGCRGRDDPAGAAGRLAGPGRPPRRRPLRRAAGDDRAHPAVRGRGAVLAHRLAEPAKGPASPCSAPSATRPTWCGGASWACPCGRCWTPTGPSGRWSGARRVREQDRRPPSGPATSSPVCPSAGPGSGWGMLRQAGALAAPPARSPRRSSSTSTAASRWRS